MERDRNELEEALTIEFTTGRRTGKTYRMLLRGILAASQEKLNLVFSFPGNDNWAKIVMQTAVHITVPLGLFVDVRAGSREILFGNGSRIRFLSDDIAERMRGVDYYVFEDDLTT